MPILITQSHCQIKWNAEVTCNEVLVVKVSVVSFREDVEVLCHRDQTAKEEGHIGATDSKGRSVGHRIVGSPLGLARLHEENVGTRIESQ